MWQLFISFGPCLLVLFLMRFIARREVDAKLDEMAQQALEVLRRG